MKTFNQFQEDAEKMNAFMKNVFMNNPTIKSITGDLKSGKIDINKLKDTMQSDKGKKDMKNLRSTAINTLIDVGQGYLNKAKDKAREMKK
tara:strand:+ start:234 stop:503 length:270 start_codon:yes stop_codon:yes gene_type:complete